MKTRQWLDLNIGDVITLETKPDEEAHVLVEGQPKFYGFVGSCRGNRAIRITREIPRADLINIRNREELIRNGG